MTETMKKLVNSSIKKMPKLIQPAEQAALVRKIPCDSPQINYMWSGGVAIGRMHRFRGPESSGKTTICNYMSGQLQRKLPGFEFKDGVVVPENKKYVVFVDFERSFDIKYATENGLLTDDEHFIYMTPDSIEDCSDALVDFVKSDEIAAIIFDSDASAPTRVSLVDPAGKACVAPNTIVEFELI
jgi:RecA/RadA recombinase